MDPLEKSCRERYAAEKDPIQREAYALAQRAGYDWYHTESAARRMAEHAAQEIMDLVYAVAALLEGLEPSSPDQFPGHSEAYLKTVAIPRAKQHIAKHNVTHPRTPAKPSTGDPCQTS